jgi:cation diffusion facilitator CzcD-associated flavoprotein CzcO
MKNKYEVIIIGSGFGGIAAAVNLKRWKLGDYLMLERDEELGGVWWRNSYPSAAVDVQSHLYSLSFEPYDWSRLFAKQYELLKYTKHVLDKYNIRQNALTNAKVTGLEFDEEAYEWSVQLEDGREFRANNVINATGGLSQPNIPDFRSNDSFKGKTMHTSHWDHNYNYRNNRVAVIGSGASAVQVIPAMAPDVKELFVFQRSPHWILPRPDRAFTHLERETFRRFPAIQKTYRSMLYFCCESRVIILQNPDWLIRFPQKIAENHIKRSIPDPKLRAKVTPTYTMGCKRILLDNDYYRALCRENVHLLSSENGIAHFNETGIHTTNGKQIDVDLIIYATGFHVSENIVAYPVIGKGGTTIDEEWKDGAHAYLGTMVPGFPNFFIVTGPNASTGHTSVIGLIESQVEYIMRAIAHKKKKQAYTIEIRTEVEKAYNEKIQKKLKGTVWQTGGCHSWYQTKDGKITTLYPTSSFIFRSDCKNFKPKNHIFGFSS